MNRSQAHEHINCVDTKHQSAQPLLRRLVRGEKVTDEDVDKFVDEDSRWESHRETLKKLAAGDKLTDDDRANWNSFSEYLHPLFEALNDGIQPDAA